MSFVFWDNSFSFAFLSSSLLSGHGSKSGIKQNSFRNSRQIDRSGCGHLPSNIVTRQHRNRKSKVSTRLFALKYNVTINGEDMVLSKNDPLVEMEAILSDITASTSPRSSTTSTSAISSSVEQTNYINDLQSRRDGRVPVILLSGFLGVGKTTFLKHLLENKKGLKIGVIVNDMAEINIDAKLLRGSQNNDFDEQADNTVELKNGCACCTMKEELFSALYELTTLSEMKNEKFDFIVIETTGISEPKNIRNTFQAAEDYDMPLMDLVKLDTMITFVDSGSFLDAYMNQQQVKDRPDIAPIDYEIMDSLDAAETAQREVVELLVEQVEVADMLVLNKWDTIDKKKQGILFDIVKHINPTAFTVPAVYSSIPIDLALGLDGHKIRSVADAGHLDEHRSSIEAAISLMEKAAVGEENGSVGSVGKIQNDGQTKAQSRAGRPKKVVNKDVHDHDHDHHHHDHDHHHHDHDHHHHDHHHDHDHSGSRKTASQTTAESRFKIGTFIYNQRRPFHPERFTQFIEEITDSPFLTLQNAIGGKAKRIRSEDKLLERVIKGLLRAKGFLWLGCSDSAALYLSLAGRFIQLQCLGRWWASVPKTKWPDDRREEIMMDFDGEFGDRRNELVFIGMGLYDQAAQTLMSNRLDECLLTDQEMTHYRSLSSDVDKLFDEFPNRMEIEMVGPN